MPGVQGDVPRQSRALQRSPSPPACSRLAEIPDTPGQRFFGVPNRRLQRQVRATVLGMSVNAVLAFAKLFAGLKGNSHALVADSIESFADLFSSVVVWRGIMLASKPADEDHPYGHGKAEPLASAVIATMLLLAAVGIAVHSLRDVFQSTQRPAAWTLLVLLAVIAVKECLFRYVHHEAEATGSSAVRSDAWHHRSDAITSLAAAIGISLSLAHGPGWSSADEVAALVAAGIIAWNGWRLLRPALEELMDTIPDPLIVARIREIGEQVVGVSGIEKCFARRMGWQLIVDMHVRVSGNLTVVEAHAISHQVKDAIRGRMPEVYDVHIHIEPARER